MTEKLLSINDTKPLLSNIGISSEFIEKVKWMREQRAGKPKEKTKAHIALEKSILKTKPFGKIG